MANYYVYVIELDSKVADFRKFRAKNPKYIKGNGWNIATVLGMASTGGGQTKKMVLLK